MQEIVRRCDVPVKRKGAEVPCGERVPDDEPTSFGLEGTSYEGDFCEKHRQDLRDCLAPYVAVAQASSRGRASTQVRKALKGRKGSFTTKDVREWLKDQGREVAPSGRIPNELIEEYKTAHAVA